LIVSPHPDDEILGAGGLMHMWKRLNRPVTVLSLTDGEAAYPRYDRLGEIRCEELRQALRAISDRSVLVVRLGIPDGHVGEHANRMRSALLSLMNPQTTVIAPYEKDGHPDHEAAAQVCLELARSQAFHLARYPIWTWRRSHPRAMLGAQWGKFSLTKEARQAKANALLCFSSQLSPYKRIPVVPDHVMAYFARPYEAFLL
jgi:LmbE family N-acetylglucosaminyl deacetylase